MAENEVVVKSGRSIEIGTETWSIRDDGRPCQFIDFFTELRHFNGNVYISMAAGILDSGNEPIADVVSRVRMNLTTAQVLHQILGQVIDDALKPVDKSTAN